MRSTVTIMFLVPLLLLMELLHPRVAEARNSAITQTDFVQVLNGTVNVTTGALGSVTGKFKANLPTTIQVPLSGIATLSVAYKMQTGSTTISAKVEAVCSYDGTTYVVPDNGGTINANCTDSNLHIATITVPLCADVGIKVTDLASTSGVTPTASIAAQ